MRRIDEVIRESCAKHSTKVAFRQKIGGTWEEFSYGHLWSSSNRVAAGLIKQGLQPGENVAILAPSSPNWVVVYLGIIKAGCIVVPIDKELKSAELRHILNDCEARALFTARPFLDTVLDILPDLPLLDKIITFSPPSQQGSATPRAAEAIESLLDEWQGVVKGFNIPPDRVNRVENLASLVHRLVSGTITSDDREENDPFSPIRTLRKELAKQGRLFPFETLLHDSPLPPLATTPDETAVILYTSGTTGRSKGAMLSHANIVSNMYAATKHFNLNDNIHTLSFLPINHVFEQVCGILLPLSLGGTVSFCESLKKLGENLAEVRPTFFLAVPAVYRMILDRITKSIGARTISQLLFNFPVTRPLVTAKIKQTFGAGTIFISGGAPLDPAIAIGITNLGLTLYQGYGITETSPIISAEQPGARHPGTVGKLIDLVEVRIDNPNEEMAGEILVRGPNVMKGYYRNPVATAEALHDGWYRTGDLGKLDSEGYLTICGRVKNLIVTPNGKNVYPEEVENELLKSPFIAEVMVYGHRDGAAEEVHAVIYPNQEAIDNYAGKSGKGPMTLADVEALLRREVQVACDRLAVYKRVKKFTIREDEFPKTTTRKIKRFAVEAQIATRE